MVRIALAALLLAVGCLASPATGASSDSDPRFRLGFQTLADLLPDVAGEPLEEERHNPANGDALQQTTTGLMVWRKADNWTAFTNGSRTWINGPAGLQERANDELFVWEVGGGRRAIPPSDPLPARSNLTPVAPSDGVVPAPNTPFPAVPMSPTPAATQSQPTATPAGVAASPTRAATATRHPSATARVSASLTARRSPTPSPQATATATSIPGAIRSPDPAGEWVTTISPSARYYTSHESSYWKSWSPSNRVWFSTEAELLAAFPGRTRR